MNKNHHNKSVEDLHQYWKNPGKGNEPHRYLGKIKRSEFLFSFIKRYANQSDKILEPGCNLGRNLNYLYENGYQNLSGIEINEEAVKLINNYYPEMSNKIKVYNESMEGIITSFSDREFDLVFTMAVLEHIHTDSEWVLKEIARITNKYLIIVESESWISERHFPRNYKNIFEALDFKEVEYSDNCEGFGDTFVCRVLEKI